MDDPRLAENSAALLWFQDWHHATFTSTDLSSKAQKNRKFITHQLYFDLHSMILGFSSYCQFVFDLFPGAEIRPSFTNQDRTENLFGCIRGSNGPNEMPNESEYGKCVTYMSL